MSLFARQLLLLLNVAHIIWPSEHMHCNKSDVNRRVSAGFLSPASRGALLTALLVMYLLLAIAAGYAAVYIWGLINRSYEGWYNVCWRVSCYFPGITLGAASVQSINGLLAQHCCGGYCLKRSCWATICVS